MTDRENSVESVSSKISTTPTSLSIHLHFRAAPPPHHTTHISPPPRLTMKMATAMYLEHYLDSKTICLLYHIVLTLFFLFQNTAFNIVAYLRSGCISAHMAWNAYFFFFLFMPPPKNCQRLSMYSLQACARQESSQEIRKI